jgi:hypothetical protein
MDALELPAVTEPTKEEVDAYVNCWRREAQREAFRWARPDPCAACGEWIGHFGGSVDRDPCRCIQQNVPLDEVRPNCLTVQRYRIGDAIRAATSKGGA